MNEVWYHWECHGCGAGPCRSARMDEEEPTQCLYLPHSITWTRLPDTPEERSREICDDRITCKNPISVTTRIGCMKHRVEPKPTPQAPQDALARARRLSECSVKDEVIAYYESAIAEERARTKARSIECGELAGEIVILRRRLNEAEARYGVAEADRNREIERREEVERKLAKAWTDDDMHESYMQTGIDFITWLYERRKTKKEKQ
jgi:hypothetical protein